MPQLCTLLLIVFILIGCASQPENQKKLSEQSKDTNSYSKDIVVSYGTQNSKSNPVPAPIKKANKKYCFDTTVNIGNGFEESVREDIFSNDSSGPTYLTIKYNNKLIYTEKSNEDYWIYIFNDSLNPTIISFGNELYELFLELDNRPNKETLKMLKIQSGRVIDSGMFPTFWAKKSHLFNDSRVVLAGIWDYGEEWTDSNNNMLMTYNPILYYEVSKSGLILDSAETIKRNRKIYGQFYGFYYNENTPPISAKRGNALSREFKRIEKTK